MATIQDCASFEGKDKCGSRKVGKGEFYSREGENNLESTKKKNHLTSPVAKGVTPIASIFFSNLSQAHLLRMGVLG